MRKSRKLRAQLLASLALGSWHLLGGIYVKERQQSLQRGPVWLENDCFVGEGGIDGWGKTTMAHPFVFHQRKK